MVISSPKEAILGPTALRGSKGCSPVRAPRTRILVLSGRDCSSGTELRGEAFRAWLPADLAIAPCPRAHHALFSAHTWHHREAARRSQRSTVKIPRRGDGSWPRLLHSVASDTWALTLCASTLQGTTTAVGAPGVHSGCLYHPGPVQGGFPCQPFPWRGARGSSAVRAPGGSRAPWTSQSLQCLLRVQNHRWARACWSTRNGAGAHFWGGWRAHSLRPSASSASRVNEKLDFVWDRIEGKRQEMEEGRWKRATSAAPSSVFSYVPQPTFKKMDALREHRAPTFGRVSTNSQNPNLGRPLLKVIFGNRIHKSAIQFLFSV